MPRSVIHLLLSLLLLVSQQMVLAHGLSHYGGLRQHLEQPTGANGAWHGQGRQDMRERPGDPEAPALHEFCVECAADAQLDLALPLPDHAFFLPQAGAAIRAARIGEGVRAPAIRLFQPRAPPQAI